MIYIILVIVGNISFFVALARLRVKHKEIFQQEFEGLSLGSIKELARMMELTIRPSKYALNDNVFRLFGSVFTLSFTTFVIYFFIETFGRIVR